MLPPGLLILRHFATESNIRNFLRDNKYPLYLVGPWNPAQRFLMHGFFTEHLHARLEQLRRGAV